MKKISLSGDKIDSFFDKISQLTKLQRILITVGSFIVIGGIFIYFLYLPKYDEIDRLNKEHKSLLTKLNSAKINAKQLPKFQKEMKEAEGKFKIAKQLLPEKKEIPSLLANVSQSGQESGLNFLLFVPKPNKTYDFYAEIPVSIEVNGGYHNLALFFDRVARLSRIVNIENIDIADSGKEPGMLEMKCTAVTYQFLESTE
jgi:type IV pilus assembly protein PilO